MDEARGLTVICSQYQYNSPDPTTPNVISSESALFHTERTSGPAGYTASCQPPVPHAVNLSHSRSHSPRRMGPRCALSLSLSLRLHHSTPQDASAIPLPLPAPANNDRASLPTRRHAFDCTLFRPCITERRCQTLTPLSTRTNPHIQLRS